MLLNTFDLIAFDTADVDNPTVHICTNESLIIGTCFFKTVLAYNTPLVFS